MIKTKARLTGEPSSGVAEEVLPRSRAIQSVARFDIRDIATVALIAALVVMAWFTFREYAISNDEGVQHHYGELIIAYYRSGFKVRDLFSFENLYLYGGLFDIIAVALAHVIPMDAYELRHILCAMIGIGGIGAAAATARLMAGPRAGLIAAVALALCGAWYGAMFNHTKDISFAAVMMGATLFLVRLARRLPAPRAIDLAGFGLLAGAALGVRSLGLLLLVYLALAIALYLPWREHGARLRYAASALWRVFPAVVLAYLIMILAWPWAALSPLNPIRGLFAFSEFHYEIRTLFAGRVYKMADVPRIYIPVYLLIRVPLVTLAGATLAMISPFWQRREGGAAQHRDLALVSLTIFFPLACQVLFRGPGFTGMRHFLFLLPPLATLAGVGFSALVDALELQGRRLAAGAVAIMCACFVWDGATLVRLHPYENLSYNALVGGLPGAFRRYDMDYWFNSMPEAIRLLEAYVRAKVPVGAVQRPKVFSVAVCGERVAFDHSVSLPQLHYDFRPEWDESEFFIAPTQMNCDQDLDGEVVDTVERLGVPIAYVKDRRAIMKRPVASAGPSGSGPGANLR
ncbi:MAG TPA: hypothetical protein VKR55_12065 [Bradyrhizobium sp.]|uniref:hypothetical protein n=1 Tax=Bradyrhizobium sp. TaxID=376 RepID=UPI002CDE37A8|nr:hypothetical protein [Bradyrhizobium sp.]HLZ02874.1 hypothetical protein [Bradyrhizobium sp.]